MQKTVTCLAGMWMCLILFFPPLVIGTVSLPYVFSTGGHSELKENLAKLICSSSQGKWVKKVRAAVGKNVSVIFKNFTSVLFLKTTTKGDL